MKGRRIDLAIEGKETPDGRIIVQGALHWPEDETVPVTMQVGREMLAVGKAGTFRRQEDGTISAFVEVEEEYASTLRHRSVQIAVDRVHSTEDEGLLTVRSARLTNVHLMPGFTNAWPDLDKRLLDEQPTVPSRGLTDEDLACAWAEYRKDCGVSDFSAAAAHKAFRAGWKAALEGDQSGVLR